MSAAGAGTGVAAGAAVAVVFAGSLAPKRSHPPCHATAAPIAATTTMPIVVHGIGLRAGGGGTAGGAGGGGRTGAEAPDTR